MLFFMLFMQLARLTLVYPYDSNMAAGTIDEPAGCGMRAPSPALLVVSPPANTAR